MKFNGFVGPSYTLNSVNVDCQRSVNLYPEIIESGTGKEGQQYYLKSTPGLEELFTVGDGPIRCVHIDAANRVLIISGDEMYKITYNGTIWTSTLMGSLETTTGTVTAESYSNYNDEDNYQYITMFADGVKVYQYVEAMQSGSPIEGFAAMVGSISGPPYDPFTAEGATHVVFIDGYYLYGGGSLKNKFYSSGWGTPANIDPLDYASSEGSPDNIVALISNYRDLWFFNERTVEIFANTGNVDFPFERVSGGFIEKGCIAPYSVAKIDGIIFWLGRDQMGQGIIYAAQGLNPQRISTHAIEQAIQSYADMSTATAYCYQSGGHSFYVLNFDEMTWVYDLSTKMWHERAYTNEGTLERHRADCHTFFAEYSLHLVGDYASGKVYKFDDSMYSDDGVEITRMRTFPHLSAGGKSVRHKKLQIDMETGVGLESGQGSDPQVVMDYSNDGGHTWSDEAWASAGQKIGGIGEYKKRVIWRKLGRARDRVYRIKITDPVPVTLLGAEIKVGVGNS